MAREFTLFGRALLSFVHWKLWTILYAITCRCPDAIFKKCLTIWLSWKQWIAKVLSNQIQGFVFRTAEKKIRVKQLNVPKCLVVKFSLQFRSLFCCPCGFVSCFRKFFFRDVGSELNLLYFVVRRSNLTSDLTRKEWQETSVSLRFLLKPQGKPSKTSKIRHLTCFCSRKELLYILKPNSWKGLLFGDLRFGSLSEKHFHWPELTRKSVTSASG